MLRTLKFSIIFIFFSSTIQSQSTFSKVYNLKVGWSNNLSNFVQRENTILVGIRHICYSDTINCLSISQFDYSGKLLEFSTISNFKMGNNQAMIVYGDSLICSGFNVNNGFLSQEILIGDHTTNSYATEKYLKNDGYHYWNNGILKHRGNYYTYGDTKKEGTGRTGTIYASIVKWDSTASKVLAKWKYRYRDGFENHCYRLQPTLDGNLAFRNEVRRVERPRSVDVITIIDTSGKIINNIDLKDLGTESKPKFIMDKSGNYYMNASKDPRKRFDTSMGGILKLNNNKRDIDWYIKLPFDSFTDIRTYYINDFYEAHNGDILVCGSVGLQDRNDDDNTGTSGFITRITAEGEIVWLRVYRIPNLLFPDIKEYHRPSFLKQIEETKTGEILCIGGANQRELDGSFTQELWIISTDQNGCVEGYECDSIVILGQQQEEYHPFVDTTLRWHELVSYLGKPNTKKYRLSADSILIGSHYYRNMLRTWDKENEEWKATKDYIREKTKKVWLNRDGEDFLLYDFGLNKSDTFKSDLLSNYYLKGLVVTKVDSVQLVDQSYRRRLSLVCEPKFFSNYSPTIWIEGIGSRWGTLNVENSCNEQITLDIRLLCFYQNDTLMWFDSTESSCFISTANEDLIIEKNKINLYPNPTSDLLHIDTDLIIHDIEIIDHLSKVVQTGFNMKDIDVSDLKTGLYFLKLTLDNEEVIFKNS